MMTQHQSPTLSLGHSPDPDDAFMWWPITGTPGAPFAAIDTGRFAFHATPDDIASLNARATERADLDITAISIHTYPYVADRYALTACGGSFGEGYGPVVIARDAHDVDWLMSPDIVVASPGERTTAHLTLRLMLGREFNSQVMPFDRVLDAVVAGEVDAGVVIHEGQLTYQEHSLTLLADLGAWWREDTGLPLPLGANVIRRNLDDRFGAGALREVTTTLTRSIAHALDQREDGLDVALGFARGLSRQRADRFVGMYVNERTLDMGATGACAIATLLDRATAAGLTPDPGEIDVVQALETINNEPGAP